jgi:hypothetical protein
MKSNPAFVRLVRRARPPSLRATLWLAFLLGMVQLAVLMGLLQNLDRTSTLVGNLRLAAWMLLVVAPPATAIAAALITAQDARSEGFPLMLATGISRWQVAQGYLLAALFRLRVLLALVVSGLPVIVAGVFVRFLSGNFWFGSSDGFYIPPSFAPRVYVIGWTLTMTAVALGLWGSSLLGAALGVWMGLRNRSALAAPLAIAVLAVLAMPLLILMTLVGPVIPTLYVTAHTLAGGLAGTVLLFMLPPYLLAAGVMWDAVRRLAAVK